MTELIRQLFSPVKLTRECIFRTLAFFSQKRLALEVTAKSSLGKIIIDRSRALKLFILLLFSEWRGAKVAIKVNNAITDIEGFLGEAKLTL